MAINQQPSDIEDIPYPERDPQRRRDPAPKRLHHAARRGPRRSSGTDTHGRLDAGLRRSRNRGAGRALGLHVAAQLGSALVVVLAAHGVLALGPLLGQARARLALPRLDEEGRVEERADEVLPEHARERGHAQRFVSALWGAKMKVTRSFLKFSNAGKIMTSTNEYYFLTEDKYV